MYWDRNAHLGVAVQDVTEVFVQKSNHEFTLYAGDMVYAFIGNDGSMWIGPQTLGHTFAKRFRLGLSLFDYEHTKTREGHVSLALLPP